MATKIFVNLPVRDLDKSIAFFKHLGFSFNPQFTDETAACMVISESIYAMLLTHPKFKMFTQKDIADATRTTEVILALDAESKAEVDKMVKNALEAGGSRYGDVQDHGWMYLHSFADLDGHQWEIMYMDISAMPKE